MTTFSKILNIIYGLIATLFLLDILTRFDIKEQAIRTFVYCVLLIGTPSILVYNSIVAKTIHRKIIGSILPISILVFVLAVGPTRILYSIEAWQTQIILYQHNHLKFKTIEFQMQDIGALGYNRRTVEVLYLTPFFMITSKVPDDIDQRLLEWRSTDKNANELMLKEP